MDNKNYHKQGNIVITILLLPLGHISNRKPINFVLLGLQREISKFISFPAPPSSMCVLASSQDCSEHLSCFFFVREMSPMHLYYNLFLNNSHKNCIFIATRTH